MKIQVAGFLLMLLSAVELCEGLRRINAMTKQQCDAVMAAEVNNGRGCQHTETFIVATLDAVNAACQNVNEALATFPVVDCTRKMRANGCVYEGNAHGASKVKLQCANGQVVNYVSVVRLA
uniref:Ribonuclease A-domain domain-containing protein n=1 Tax=Xiphophorus couchianus TaxID=32473 RepID=A0A3B5M1Z8_9TELE